METGTLLLATTKSPDWVFISVLLHYLYMYIFYELLLRPTVFEHKYFEPLVPLMAHDRDTMFIH